jgi:MFS family permease
MEGSTHNKPETFPQGIGRWIVLILTCLGLFGQFYAFDNPSALNEQLKEHMQAISPAEDPQYAYYFNLLYSVYSLPNVILPLIMGLAVDRCGCRLVICILGAAVVLGHVIFTIGVTYGSWSTMILGRIVFGFGGESVQVAQNCLLFRWFKGNEVAFALGLNLSVARAGSVLNDVLSPWVAARGGVISAMWVGSVLCFGSFLANVWSVVVDKQEGERSGLGEPESDDDMSLKEVLGMSRIFWALTGLCVILYCAILPFNNIASAFFVETDFASLPLAEAQQRAGNVMSIMFLVSALGTPPFGALVDFIGMRTHFLLFSSVLVTFTYATIFILPPVATMLCLGTVYTVFAGALWPTFALTVPQRQLGTAYGVATALQNGGLAVAPLIVGYLQASTPAGNFTKVMQLFMVFGLLGVVFAAEITRENAAVKGSLNLPSKLMKEAPSGAPNEKSKLVEDKAS